jgi:site-specific recombinase XerD
MASLHKPYSIYYARIRICKNNSQKSLKPIPLITDDEIEARTRLLIVNNYEKNIKDGIIKEYHYPSIFPWLNDKGSSKYIAPKINIILDEYLDLKKSKVAESTIRRERDVFNSFFKFLKESKISKSVDILDTNLIEDKYMPYMDKKKRDNKIKSGTIALNLRVLKTFFNWLYEREIIALKIKIKIPKVNKDFKYLTEREMRLAVENISCRNEADTQYYKDCLKMYETIGCRPAEPLKGKIEDDWLVISAEENKDKTQVRTIHLSDNSLSIILQMRKRKDDRIAKGQTEEKAIYNTKKEIGKKLREALIKADIYRPRDTNLYSYRHSYAIFKTLVGEDVFKVSKEMGHENISTTTNYLKFRNDYVREQFKNKIKEWGDVNPQKIREAVPLSDKLKIRPIPPDGKNDVDKDSWTRKIFSIHK